MNTYKLSTLKVKSLVEVPDDYTGIVVCWDGDRLWYKNGEVHRDDGPAFEGVEGTKQWCRNGKCHREDGPAIECASGDKSWFLKGKCYYTFEEFFEATTDEGKEALIWRMHEYRQIDNFKSKKVSFRYSE